MGRVSATKRTAFGRDVFLSGEYIEHFCPDSSRNPFAKLYGRKKKDTMNIIRACRSGASVLDVGAGMGRLSLGLARAAQHKIFLVDISTDMLRLALHHAKGLDNARVVNADAHCLPFEGGAFDLVVGLDLFCHLENPERALREFHRVLAHHGMLILDSTNSNPLWALFYPRYVGKNPLNWLKIMKLRGVLPGWEAVVRHYSRKEFLSILRQAGFQVIRNIDYGPALCPKWHLAVSEKAV